MSGHVTIQINSLDALKRLLGDDPEMGLEVRRSVMIDFLRAHLEHTKGKFASELLRASNEGVAALQAALEAELLGSKLTNRNNYGTPVFVLSPSEPLRDAVKAAVQTMIQDTIQKEVQEQWTKLLPTIDAKIETSFGRAIGERVEAAIKSQTKVLGDAMQKIKDGIREFVK